jgi:hypothetical protein
LRGVRDAKVFEVVEGAKISIANAALMRVNVDGWIERSPRWGAAHGVDDVLTGCRRQKTA